jgi:hypothetical protein
MFTGITSHGGALIAAMVVLTGAAILHGGAATADPDQDQKFLTLLNDKDIPPVDEAGSLIDTAHKACAKLDGGMPVDDLVELMRNNGFATNPLARLYPQARVTRTIDRFISSAVQAYCPYDEGKIATITGDSASGSSGPTPIGAAYTHSAVSVRAVWQAAAGTAWPTSVIAPIPSGEVPPSNPPPAPAQAPPPQQAQQAPEQPPPTRRYVPPAPQRPQPPPQQAPQEAEPPPPEAGPSPQQAEPPPPPPEPPPPPPPAPPHRPGFVQLAP